MIKERRTNKRINVSLPINYEILDGNERKCGHTICKDISNEGIKIILDKFYPNRSKFLIKVNLENMHRVVESVAESIWSFNESYSNRYYNGLKFTDINIENQKLLKDYVFLRGTSE